jgi:GDPmannose 4,6-dehydratase
VSLSVARIKLGLEHELRVGDLEARRDWGSAPEYVRAMWLMLQQDEPGDYVIATGRSHSVRDLVDVAFAHVGLDHRDYVRSDASLVRGRAELHRLVGDSARARELLGWEPTSTFAQLIGSLVDADLAAFAADAAHA